MLATLTALAEPNRLRIVEELRTRERSVNELCEQLSLSQPLVSKHLRVLREAGLVEVDARAQQRFYGLRAKPLAEMHDWLTRYRRIWDARFQALDAVLERMEKEPRNGKKRRR